MAKLSDLGIEVGGLGILKTFTIPGEPAESYARRCELETQRNRSYNDPNDAEKEYRAIFTFSQKNIGRPKKEDQVNNGLWGKI